VPIDFLSAAQVAGYGRYGEPPSARQLERYRESLPGPRVITHRPLRRAATG